MKHKTILWAKMWFAFGIILFFVPGSASAIEALRVELDNGMVVLVAEKPDSPIVAVYGLVKTGSATEGEFLGTGVSHYLEHMLFKGTENRGVGEIAGKIQAVGGSINAATGRDYTIYTINVPYDQFAIAIDILADVLRNATLDPEEAAKERDVILNEMRMHNDNPDRKLSEVTSKNIYLNHPYRHPVIGYEELFKGLTPDSLRQYYKKHYVPNNIVVTIAGLTVPYFQLKARGVIKNRGDQK